MVHEHLFYPTGPGVYGNGAEASRDSISRGRDVDVQHRRQARAASVITGIKARH